MKSRLSRLPRLSRSAIAVLCVVLAIVMTMVAAPAVSAEAPAAPAPGEGFLPEVAAIPASSVDLNAARRHLDGMSERLNREREDLDRTEAELTTVQADLTGLRGMLARRQTQIPKVEAGLARVRADLRALATEWFVSGFGKLDSIDPSIDHALAVDLKHQQALAAAATAGSLDQERFLSGRLDQLTTERSDLTAQGSDLERRAQTLDTRRARLSESLARGAQELLDAGRQVELARLNATVDGTDMSIVALDAYYRAARGTAITDPGCGVTWWALAGIGRTESRHGTYGGALVGVTGLVTVPILGPMLDGSNGFKVIADSDGGVLDGTSTTDRAVGPMQFLPSSWRAMGRDGTGDGQADPQNLYDAALGAAAYLCRSGPVREEAGLRRAYFSYNRSQAYVDLVLQRATNYRTAVPLT